MSLLVIGTIALDSIKTPAGIKNNILGGSAVHFCMSARLFTKTNIVGVVGNDFPKKHINMLRQKGINTSGLQTGNYVFYFGVDGHVNGIIDNPLYYDSVEVDITP